MQNTYLTAAFNFPWKLSKLFSVTIHHPQTEPHSAVSVTVPELPFPMSVAARWSEMMRCGAVLLGVRLPLAGQTEAGRWGRAKPSSAAWEQWLY